MDIVVHGSSDSMFLLLYALKFCEGQFFNCSDA